MKFASYLRDKFVEIILSLGFAIVFTGFMFALKTNLSAIIIFWILFGALLFSVVTYGFLRKRNFYAKTEKILTELDKKYLLSELIDEPSFFEGKFFYDALWQTNKSMREKVSESEKQMLDFRDYVELWVHEIKTPLSGLSLSTKTERTYVDEIGNYIEQALFYSKINTVEKDYIIKQVSLDKIVKETIKNNKDALIGHKIKVELQNLNHKVHSDSKWLGFIINQIILNAIKYRKNSPIIKIEAQKQNRQIILTIEDNGIGIKKSELKRVFEKGFTGANGRNLRSSTGMGLYIAKKLSEDLGHEISVDSTDGEYTKVSIIFGEHDFFETLQKR